MPAAIEYVRAGKLRALAVTTAARSEALPDVPTVGEHVPGYEASSLYGVAAPRNTPAEIVDKLNREINAALTDPAMKTRLADLGGIVLAAGYAFATWLLFTGNTVASIRFETKRCRSGWTVWSSSPRT